MVLREWQSKHKKEKVTNVTIILKWVKAYLATGVIQVDKNDILGIF